MQNSKFTNKYNSIVFYLNKIKETKNCKIQSSQVNITVFYLPQQNQKLQNSRLANKYNCNCKCINNSKIME